MSGTIGQFRQAIHNAGLSAPDDIIDDGKIHRFSTNGKARDDAGWYVLHSERVATGMFGCWRSSLQSNWCAKSVDVMSLTERDAHRASMDAMRALREAEATQRHESAATDAAQRLATATSCTQHSYLTSKGVKGYGVRVDGSGALIVPLIDTDGKTHSLQKITANGDKRFLPGGRVKGCYHPIGKLAGLLIVCEGYATGASIHECTGHAVAVAFNADNLEAVAVALHIKYPALKIIIAADDDHLTDGNPGITKAKVAARAVGGLVAVPLFPTGRGEKHTDFNDLHKLAGADAVKACIDTAPAVDDWPELQPLIAQIAPERYPMDALPDAVRCAVEEVAGFVKAPIPLIASSALAALSLAIQAHVDVERADKLHGPTSLFLLAIADSGERKSTCDSFFTKAIKDYQAEQQEAAKPLFKAHKSEHDAWDAQRGGLKEKIKALAKDGKPSAEQEQLLRDLDAKEPITPKVPRLIYGDATPEALTFSLAKQWPSGGVISSEAGSVFGGHGMSGDSVMRNLAVLNQLWDGATLSTERRTSESFTVRGARLTMALQVQEATIRAFFDSTKGLARGTGFLARFLVSWPESTQGTRNFTEAPASWPALTAVCLRPC